MARTLRASALLTSASMSRCRFLLVLFEVRMWRLKARLLLIFPDADTRNRLTAPRFVFSLGMLSPQRLGGAGGADTAAAGGGAAHFLGARIMSRNGPSWRG